MTKVEVMLRIGSELSAEMIEIDTGVTIASQLLLAVAVGDCYGKALISHTGNLPEPLRTRFLIAAVSSPTLNMPRRQIDATETQLNTRNSSLLFTDVLDLYKRVTRSNNPTTTIFNPVIHQKQVVHGRPRKALGRGSS